jgi:hypothetical protein
MQAEGIRTGDRYDMFNDRGRVTGGWTATGDAVITYDDQIGRDQVYVPVRYHDGGDGVRVWNVGQQVPLTFGAGQQSRFPEGTPEYDEYRAKLRAELAKFAAQEPPYDTCPKTGRSASVCTDPTHVGCPDLRAGR